MSRNDLPSPGAANFGQRLREAMMTYLGRQGDPLDRGVTLRDLLDSGLARLRPGYTAQQAATSGGALPIAPEVQAEEPDLTPPPTPTGFAVSAAISHVFIEHDAPLYLQGHGHLRTRVYGKIVAPGDPLPVFADAVEIAQFTGTIHAHPSNPATTWRLWIKWESADGVLSVSPAGGTNGLVATTGQDVSTLLQALTGEITESQLYEDLGARIDLIDDPTTGLVKKVGDLETTYGSTASAAASAAAAAQSASDAIAAKTAALLAQSGAETASASSAQSASDSVAAKVAAISAQSGAVAAKDAAVLAKTSAETAQAGASTSAQQASNSATGAAGSASSASQSATTAANAATQAGNSATAAATSASSAATYATSSETASTASQTAKVAAEAARDAASGNATSAATSAQTATAKATDASESATAASTSATTATTKASEASTSASQASTSATNAAGSAASASTSATTAANSATAAGNSASAAATSATNANTYATNAETASTASTSAKVAAESARDAASGSASAAASSASTATTKAIEAAQSASSASTSANTATTKAAQAATSATNAATSETNAAGSASSASTSATNAANSANAAGGSATAAAGSASTATTQATNAGNSASAANTAKVAAESARDAASGSATAAATSASTASTKATEASQSATAASSSATTASTQASQAGVYASNAATSATNAAGSASSAASALTQIQASNATALAAVQTLATTTAGPDGATAQYTVKVDTNGYVAGFGLSSALNSAGAGTSNFAVRADAFYIASPSGPGVSPTMPFIVRTTPTTINGESVPAGVYLTDAFIQNGTIERSKIANLAVDDAKIADLKVDKLTSGTLQVGQFVQSTGYSSGQAGFRIDGDGNAEFNNATVRGTVFASDGQFTGEVIALGSGKKARMWAGDFEAYKDVPGVGLVLYKALSRVESGVGANNVQVTIPGYFLNQPRVIVSPANIRLYDSAYANQTQSLQCEVRDLVQTSAGSMVWRFTPVAMLSLGASAGQVAINQSSGQVSTGWTSGQYVTPANTTAITPSVTLASYRGTGTSGGYYQRTARWRVQYLSGGSWVNGAWTTIDLASAVNASATSDATFTFPSAAAWTFRIEFEAYDTGGTFSTTVEYEYATDSASRSDAQTIQAQVAFAGPNSASASLNYVPSYSLPSGWTLTGVGFSYVYSYSVSTGGSYTSGRAEVAQTPYSGGLSIVAPPNSSGSNVTRSRSASSNQLNFSVSASRSFSSDSATATLTLHSVTGTYSRRRPLTNSTTAANTFTLGSYGYQLNSAQVLASGTLNWVAIGE